MKTIKNDSILKNKKIAFVHDEIVAFGGGERVLDTVHEILPWADFYTSIINSKLLSKSLFYKKIKTTWVQKLQIFKYRPLFIQLLSPFIWPTINLKKYDLIISHGGFYLSNMISLISSKPAVLVHYSISPPKNLYYSKNKRITEKILNLFYYPFLRVLDKYSISRVNNILAVSKDVKTRIQHIYSRKSQVVYPPVVIPAKMPSNKVRRSYYLYAGRLGSEKNLNLLINAFNKNGLPLYIAGIGKEEKALKNIAAKNIVFLGFKNKKDLDEILDKAKFFVHVAENDDFPLAPIEAMGHGVPLIVHNSGGTREAVIEGKTGIIFDNLTVGSLNKAILKAEKTEIDYSLCYRQAKKYREDRFKKEFLAALENAYKKSKTN